MVYDSRVTVHALSCCPKSYLPYPTGTKPSAGRVGSRGRQDWQLCRDSGGSSNTLRMTRAVWDCTLRLHFAKALEVHVQQKGVDLSSAAACQLAATFLRDAALCFCKQGGGDLMAGHTHNS